MNLFAVSQKQQYELQWPGGSSNPPGTTGVTASDLERNIKFKITVLDGTSEAEKLTLNAWDPNKIEIKVLGGVPFFTFTLTSYTTIVNNDILKVAITWTDPVSNAAYSSEGNYRAGKTGTTGNVFMVANGEGLALKLPDPTISIGGGFEICDGLMTGKTTSQNLTVKNSPAGATIKVYQGATDATSKFTVTGLTKLAINSIFPTAGSPHAYKVALVDAGGTTLVDAAFTVKVNTLPDVKINNGVIPVDFCDNQEVTVTASGASTYIWSGTGLMGANNQASAKFKQTVASEIQVIGTNSTTTCSKTVKVTPVLNTPPTITAALANADDANGCVGVDKVNINSTINGGATPYRSYSWSNGGGTNKDITNLAIAQGEKKYAITVTDAKGCTGTSSEVSVTGHSVTVTPNPGTVTVNNGDKATLNAGVAYAPVGGQSTPINYEWTPTADIESNGNTLTATSKALTTQGTKDFIITVTDGNGCEGTGKVTVTVGAAGAALAVTATGATECENKPINLTASASGGTPPYTNWNWVPSAGLVLSSNTAQNPTVTTGVGGTAPGTYTATVEVTDTKGDKKTSAQVTIEVKAVPVLTSVTPSKTTLNVGETVTLTANPQLTDGTTYAWTGNSLPAGNAATITTNALATAGPQTYSVTATKNGCTSAAQQTTVTVEGGGTPTPGDPNILLTIEQQACLGSGDKMQIKMAGQGGDSFQFDLWHGGSVKRITGGLGPWFHDVAQADQGLYEIKDLKVLKDGAWITVTSTSNVNATFRNLPAVKIQGLANGVVTMNHCDNEKLILSGAGDAGVGYTWNTGVNDGQPFTPTNGMVCTVTGTDAFGCKNTASVTVSLLQAPVVKIEPLAATEICQGTPVLLKVTMASNANTYAWNPAIPADGNVTPVMTTKYSVTGTAVNGCKAVDTVKVTVNIAPEILEISKNPRTIAIGKNVDFSIVADRADTYKWEYRKNAADAWTTLSDMPASATTPGIEGATTDKLLLTKVPRGWDGMNLKVSALNQCGSVDTTFHLFVKECFDIEGSIAMAEGIQPEETPGENIDGWYCKGMRISLKATIRPEDPSNTVENPKYKWMIDGEPSDKVIESDSSVLSWIPASWETDIVVKVGVYCDGACDTVYSRYLRLKAREYDDVSVKIISSGDPELTYCLGEEIIFSVAPKNPGKKPVYTWQKDVSGLGTGEFKVLKMSQPSTWIKVTMTPSPEVCVRGIVSDSIYLTVKPTANPKMWITNTINDTLACSGDILSFMANYQDAGENPKISWQQDIWNIGSGQFAQATLADKDMWIKCTLIPGKNVCYDGEPLADSMIIRVLEHGTVTIASDMDGKEPGDELTFTSKVENMPVNPMYEWFVNANLTSEPSDTYISSVLRQGDVVALAVSGQKICQTRVFSNEIVVNFNKSSRDTMVEIYRNEKIHKLKMFKAGDQVNRFMLSELPKFGQAVMTPSGLFDYYPNPDFVGSDFVRYTITNKYDKTKVEEGYIYITVKSIDRYFIPNIITPNEDGVNDTWKLDFLSEYPDHIVTVYNWLGKVVFQAKKYGNDWGGKGLNNASYVSQANLPNGVYTYVIDLGNKVILKGWIEIRADFNRGNYR